MDALHVGAKVRIKRVKGADFLEHVGHVGYIVRVERGTAGVGDSDTDPFFHVLFTSMKGRDGYWTEELELV